VDDWLEDGDREVTAVWEVEEESIFDDVKNFVIDSSVGNDNFGFFGGFSLFFDSSGIVACTLNDVTSTERFPPKSFICFRALCSFPSRFPQRFSFPFFWEDPPGLLVELLALLCDNSRVP
jgi:hypothetical protein